MPDELKNSFKKDLNKSVNEFIKKLEEQNKKDFSVSEDPILEEIISLFNANMGDDFVEKEKILEEAERRIKDKIPPGYKDNDKDRNNKYGDYFLWKQILEYGSKIKKPVIFITSERKSDWWEIVSGKTIGLLPELKKRGMGKDRLSSDCLSN